MNENLRSDDPPVTSMASPVIWSPVDPWVLSMASHWKPWKPKERAPDADEILQAARTEARDGYMAPYGTIQGFQAIRLCLKIGDP